MTEKNKQPESDVGKMLNTAVSGITGMVYDMKNQLNGKIEAYLAKMDLVKREELDLVKEMLTKVIKEQDSISKKLAKLEEKK